MCKTTVAIFLGFMCSAGFTASASAARIHVDHQATGSGSGASWTNACVTLQAALDIASGGDEIWVADGTYYPSETFTFDEGTSKSFAMLEDVRLFGGFQGISRSGGGETTLNQRNPEVYETNLSGELGSPGKATTLSTLSLLQAPTSTPGRGLAASQFEMRDFQA